MNQGIPFNRKTPPHILTLVAIAGLAALTMNIFLPSLPEMARFFGADYAIMQFAVSGYLTVTAILQLVIGPASDRYGRRPTLIACLLVYLAATLLCIFATSLSVFMAGRILQAAVVSGFVLSRAIVRDMVPMEEAASMIGYVTMGMTLVPMIGPTLGGYLNDLFSWQATFVTLLVLGVLVLIIAYLDLGETNKSRSESFGAQFAAWPKLITSPRFWGYTLTATFSSGAFFVFLGAGPFIGSVVLKLTPGELGLQFFYITAGYMVGNFVSGRYAKRIGVANMMLGGGIIGTLGAALSMVLLAWGVDPTFAFFVPQAVVGFGNGMTLPSANAGIVSVKPDLAGSASGLAGAITIGGGASFSVLASALVTEQSGPWPVLNVMLISGLLSMAAILFVRFLGDAANPGEDQ
ncbi:multidrug effflux MFS transporter [Rhizobium sp. RU36D]|uniref:multidrug effflux MFS transporter n=1 Tax=Rhizobium sp. RU36D TaxID=1907415 RepID=UPI0009D81629|nr:multidrug effflux MFS transporter [Rhizobium sp. RU36D]SMC80687.1 MFS transporter, DHA1 family, bicyclomycin/chloramphenicol resistance protein [Rhizobium sp. RU36D]